MGVKKVLDSKSDLQSHSNWLVFVQ